MNKIVSGLLISMLSLSVFAADRDTHIQNAKDMMSFEDSYVAETAKMAVVQDEQTRAHYIQTAKDMMSFEDGFVAETAASAKAQKNKKQKKGSTSKFEKVEPLHIDP